jgi:hypothetical protein
LADGEISFIVSPQNEKSQRIRWFSGNGRQISNQRDENQQVIDTIFSVETSNRFWILSVADRPWKRSFNSKTFSEYVLQLP